MEKPWQIGYTKGSLRSQGARPWTTENLFKMKRGKKLSALFLALVMAFSLAVPAGAANWDEDLTGHIVILHTNDVHGVGSTVDDNALENYGYVASLKAAYEAAGAEVLLMDAGDFSQGSLYVNESEGATAVELMNMAGYDVATTGNHEFDSGNHEFDFGYSNLQALMEEADFPILAANAEKDGANAVDGASTTFQLGDVTVGVFGLATPETATKAHPAKLEGVTFLADEELFACAQEQVDELTAAGCDYIICLGHLGIDAESTGNRSIDLLENVTGIDVFRAVRHRRGHRRHRHGGGHHPHLHRHQAGEHRRGGHRR